MVNKKFCYCCDLKVGSCIYVGLTLILSIIQFFGTWSSDRGYGYRRNRGVFEEFAEMQNSKGYKLVNSFISFIYIFICIIFLIGVAKKKPNLLLPFIWLQYIELSLFALLLVMLLVALPLKVSLVFVLIFAWLCSLAIDVYSFYNVMKYGPDELRSSEAPQVVVQQQMPQYCQPQYVYYPASSAYTNQQGPMGAVPMFYAPQPYNPNVCAPPSDGMNLMPPSNNAVTDSSTNNIEKVHEQNKE